MSKMGLYNSFEYLKHKLWPKEGPGVIFSIWLSTIKSRKLLWFPCVQVACHIPLESSQRGIQICFRPHFNRRSAHKVMGFQSHGGPNFKNFGSPGTKWHFGASPVARHREYYNGEGGGFPQVRTVIRRKVVASPKSGPWWVLWVCVCMWWVCAPKVL